MTNLSVRKFLAAAAAMACLSFAPLAQSAIPASNLPDFTDLVDKVGPAVVNIRTTTRITSSGAGSGGQHGAPGMGDGDMSEFFRRFFGIPLPQAPHGDDRGDQGDHGGSPDQSDNGDGEANNGVGSGFILSADGYVMTNAHVVDDADNIYVTLTDKREFKAKLIGVDDRTDIAVVKIDASSLPTVTIGDSNKVRVGEWVVAIGSPFGLDNTVTAGIVSAKGRETGDYLPFIQTDAAVNPGNSGGPLINMQGEVIGINSQIYSRTGGFMGIAFAIPIDDAMRVADQLETTGKVVRGRIAVSIGEVTKDVADSLGLPHAEGALVSSVEPGGPADKAGLQPGDIILKFNGVAVDTDTDLPRMVGDTKPGTQATVTYWRKGQSRDVPITVVQTQPDKTAKADAQQAPPPKPRPSNSLGVTVSDLSADQIKSLKLRTGGVQVEAVDGPAARVGLAKGDIILRVGDTDVSSAKQFEQLTAHLDPKKMVAVLVRRGENTQFVPIKPRGQGK
ncbi:DegQ family serine endoprotease [Trinickia dinghuensis]|uniref:Probable periplasmic serine endoprotease DegP-like n=1 Tax=Trinickia dinghuensis TaxID=2291023 RepID=A0A3D8JWT5_9BURK|nr:DegQ family serine endoprotease [Trinickia dinghuensis]RDU97094.1 DegQ family serine endoprotease [Trinickia dinghuensis]